MEQLVKTESEGYIKNAIPAKDNSVLIINDKGKFESSQVIPDKTQNNIAVEKIAFSDKTTNDVTATKHGLIPKLPNDSSYVMTGTGWGKLPRTGTGFGNIWWVKNGETIVVGDAYENVVSNMIIDLGGTLRVDGILTIL